MMKIHVEVYIASRILGQKQGTFSPHDIVNFIQTEFHDFRPGVQPHADSSCVANIPLNYPNGHNYLWRTERATLRVFRSEVDLPHPERKNCNDQPKREDFPARYLYLLDQINHEKKTY